jgi:preprotein translocase subunit SecA
MKRWQQVVRQVAVLEAEMEQLSNRDLRKQALSLRFRAKSGERLRDLLPEAFALVREAARRTIGLRHFDVQILGGTALFHGAIAEMETGEGKTLTATLPLFLHALVGRGAHLATVNDYLAERDAENLRPVYEAVGMTVGVVLTKDSSEARRAAYGCDITYGTAKEFGFDFLRDRLLLRRMGHSTEDFLGGGSTQRWESGGEQPVQRGFHFCIVDEADSILIDEARTPLIIGSLGDKAREQIVATFQWAAANVEHFEEDVHYDYDYETKKVELTVAGRQLVRRLPRENMARALGLVDVYEYVERAIRVYRDYLLDREYVVENGEIIIVDEYTGRKAEGRKWRDGIHQAIEAKEAVEVTVPTGQAARITVQDLFLRYKHLAANSARSTRRPLWRSPRIGPCSENVGRIASSGAAKRNGWRSSKRSSRFCKTAALP